MLALSALSGVALAGGVLIARPDAAPREASSAQRAAVRSIDASKLTLRDAGDRYASHYSSAWKAVRGGTAEVAVTAPDPAGGPPWAIRTFQRQPIGDGRPVWCAQLGRIVDEQFVWIRPGSRAAERLPVQLNSLSSCAGSSPIAQRAGVQIATMPDRDLRDAGAQPSATLIWGAVGGSPQRAELVHDTASGPVELRRHGFLKVLPGTARAGRTLLRVTEADGRQRGAIPPGFWLFALVPPRPNQRINPPATVRRLESLYRGTPAAGTYVLAGRAQRPGEVPVGIFAKRGAKRPCATAQTPVLADRPAQALAVEGGVTGLVTEAPEPCMSALRSASKSPVFLNLSAGSGLDDRPEQRAEMRRRRTELRRDYASASAVLAVPPGTKLLEVRSPIGVQVVRVRSERVTFVSWDGQRDVGKALFPVGSNRARGRARIRSESGVTFRALDAAGRPIGLPLSTRRR